MLTGFFLIFSFSHSLILSISHYLIQLLTPSVVAIAVRMLTII
jgi:hypothetical protein